MIRCLLLGLLLVLSACSSGGGSSSKGSGGSGGGGGKRESASVTAASQHVTITVVENQFTTATVDFNFVGDGMAALIPPGIQQPYWLFADLVRQTQNTARFMLTVESPPPPGTYRTTIRFASIWLDTEDIDWVDMDIILTVTPAPRLVNVSSVMEFSAYTGGNLPSPVTLQLNDNRLASSVSASIDYFGEGNWLSVEPQGNTFVIRPKSTAIIHGQLAASVTLVGADGLTQIINVNYQLNDAFDGSQQSLAFTAAAGGDLPSPITLLLSGDVDTAAFTTSINYGYSAENWLQVEQLDRGFKIEVTETGFPPDLHGASVSFSIGGRVVRVVEINYQVQNAFTTPDLYVVFNGIVGAGLSQPVLLPVRAGVDSAKITARLSYSGESNDWLQFEPTSEGLLAKVSRLDLLAGDYFASAEFLINDKPIQVSSFSYNLKRPFPDSQQPFLSAVAGGALPQPIVLPVLAGVDPSAFTINVNYQSSIVTDPWLQVDVLSDGFRFSVTTTEIVPFHHYAVVEFTLGETVVAGVGVNYYVESPSFAVGTVSGILIDNATVEADLQTTLEVTTDSPLVSWRVLGTSPLLRAVADKPNSRVNLSIDKTVLSYIENGQHEEWVEVEFTHPYFPVPTVSRVQVDVEIAFVEMQYATPRVVYLGDETKVLIRGNQIGNLTSLEAGNIPLENLRRINASEIEVTIPADLPVGEYRFEIPKALELERDVAHIIVKPHAVYPTGSVTLPSAVGQVAYDPAREQLYFTGNSAVYTLAHDGVEWEWSLYPINSPVGIALTQNGEKLLIGARECDVWEVELVSGDVELAYPTGSFCYSANRFGLIAPLYTGLTIVANVDQWPDMRVYPTWNPVDFPYPGEYHPVGVASMYGTHIIWAGSNNSGPLTAYIFDARSQVFNTLGTVAGNNYSESLFSISANGNRISHYDDIYNAQLAHIGSLAGAGANSANRVGVSPKGSLAGMFDSDSSNLRIFDISGKAPFPELEYDFSLPNETTSVHKIMFSEDDRYMFVFATNPNTNVNRFYVFELE